MRTQSIQLVFNFSLTAFSLTACGDAYFDEDTNQLVGAVESVGSDPYQNQEELWWLLSCNEGDYACNCQGDQEWSWKWGGGWFPYYGYDCGCFDGFEGEYCERDTRAWGDRVDGWLKGQYCEYSWDSEYYEDESDYEPHDFGDFKWEHSPSPEYTTERACVQADCLWVSCTASEESITANGDTLSEEKMCNNFQGPWEGKCEFDHYAPGPLAFAGPGEHCGFVYPKCPDVATNNCFCGEAAKEAFVTDWCDGGDMTDWCPTRYRHDDGRSQPCQINGYTFSPQNETVNGVYQPNGAEICEGR